MKKLKFLISIAVVVIFLNSCSGDATEKYIGTWSGSQTIIVPGLNMNQTDESIVTITKSVNENQIVITSQADGSIIKGNISGNTITYDKQSRTENSDGQTITAEMEGSGTLDGNTISDSGTITYFIEGKAYKGTWSGTSTKQ